MKPYFNGFKPLTTPITFSLSPPIPPPFSQPLKLPLWFHQFHEENNLLSPPTLTKHIFLYHLLSNLLNLSNIKLIPSNLHHNIIYNLSILSNPTITYITPINHHPLITII